MKRCVSVILAQTIEIKMKNPRIIILSVNILILCRAMRSSSTIYYGKFHLNVFQIGKLTHEKSIYVNQNLSITHQSNSLALFH